MENLEPGMDIYRNLDVSFEKQIKIDPPKRVIPVNFEISEKDSGIIVKVSDNEGNETVIEKEIEKVLAENKEKAIENIKIQFSKLGDTIYEAEKIEILFKAPLFLNIAFINSLRREVIEKLNNIRKESYKREENRIVPSNYPYPIKKINYESNVSNSLAEKFYDRHGAKVEEPAFEILSDKKGRRVMTTKHCLRYFLGKCTKEENKDIQEPLYLVDRKGQKYLLKFDCSKCQMEIYNKI
jgi:putative protease